MGRIDMTGLLARPQLPGFNLPKNQSKPIETAEKTIPLAKMSCSSSLGTPVTIGGDIGVENPTGSNRKCNVHGIATL
jgi:hypothetical protein